MTDPVNNNDWMEEPLLGTGGPFWEGESGLLGGRSQKPQGGVFERYFATAGAQPAADPGKARHGQLPAGVVEDLGIFRDPAAFGGAFIDQGMGHDPKDLWPKQYTINDLPGAQAFMKGWDNALAAQHNIATQIESETDPQKKAALQAQADDLAKMLEGAATLHAQAADVVNHLEPKT